MKKKSWVSLIISAAVLTALLVLGFGSGVFQPEALSVQGRQGAETLLRLLTMAAAVLLVEKLQSPYSDCCIPRAAEHAV